MDICYSKEWMCLVMQMTLVSHCDLQQNAVSSSKIKNIYFGTLENRLRENMTTSSETSCEEHITICAITLTFDTVAKHRKVFE